MKWLLLCLISAGLWLAADEKDLILGISDNPPSTFVEKSLPKGFVVDIMRDFARSHGYKVRYEVASFPELMSKMREGEIDVIGPVGFSQERSQYMLFCREPLMLGWTNLVISRKSDFKMLQDLAGHSIGVVHNDIAYQLLKGDLEKQGIKVEFREYSHFQEIIADLKKERIEAGLIHRSSLVHLLRTDRSNWNLKLMPGSLYYESFFLAVNRRKPQLAESLDQYLYKIKNVEQEFFKQAYDRWYSEPYSRVMKFFTEYWPWLAALVVTIITAFIAFNLVLRRRVIKATLEISRQKSYFQYLFQNMPAGIVIVNEKSQVLDMNKEFQLLFGFTLADMQNQNLDDLIHDEKTRGETMRLNQQILQGMRLDREVIRWNKEKKPLYLHLIGSPIRLDEQILGILLIYIDISERKRMEEEIIRSRHIESIGVLAGGIAHDFNNMLTGILGNISLLKRMSRDETILSILEKAEKATLKTKGLTRQLLTFSKGSTPLKRVTSIVEIVRDATDLVLSGSNIKSSFKIDAPLANVDIDATQISQVINNILLNARDAMPEGGEVEIWLRNIEYTEESEFLEKGKYVAVSFRDHGPGISQEMQRKLFVPFHTSKENGSGLGLAISYSILNKHSGNIKVESKEGEGATFTIYLPATDLPVVREVKPEAKVLGRARILLMDDEEIVRNVFLDMLTAANIEIDTAVNSRETIDMYRKALQKNERYDLVFLDLTVPGDIGGIKTLEKLREIDPDVRAVATSGYIRHDLLEYPHEFHFLDILQKPFQVEDLLNAISRNLK